MVAFASLVFGAVVSFTGTSPDALAKSVADATGHNTVIVTSAPLTIGKKFSYDADSADSISQNVRAGTGLVMAPGVAPIFSDQGYVLAHFQPLVPNVATPAPEAAVFPPKDLDGGLVTLSTAGSTPVKLGSFVDVKWAKPLKVDFLLRDLAVSAVVTKMPERDFLSAVAKAAGAIFVPSDDGYSIVYDPDQLRMRLANTLQKVANSDPIQVTDLKRAFYIASVNALGQDALMTIFEDPAGTPRLDVLPNTDLSSAAVTYIRALEALSAQAIDEADTGETGRPRRAQGGATGDILSRVDNRATVHLRMNAGGSIVLSVPVISGKTSAYIEL